MLIINNQLRYDHGRILVIVARISGLEPSRRDRRVHTATSLLRLGLKTEEGLLPVMYTYCIVSSLVETCLYDTVSEGVDNALLT